eukprot:1130452-Rhodomonas_salina.2
MGVAKGAHVAALSWKAHLFAGGVARGVAVGTLFPGGSLRPPVHVRALPCSMLTMRLVPAVDSIKTKKQLGQKINLKIGSVPSSFM